MRMLRHFTLDLTASRTAQLTGLTRKSVTAIFLKIRERIFPISNKAASDNKTQLTVLPHIWCC